MPEVGYESPCGPLNAYLAVPGGAGPWPGVVVIQDAFGLSDDIRDQADRLAAYGYLAVAPDLYSAGGGIRCVAATVRAARSGVGRAYEDIEAARQWLTARPACTGRVGVIGFCMGGGFALLCAPRYDFQVASVNYGDVPDDAERRLAGCCPVVGSYGGRDRRLASDPDRLRSALASLGVEHDVKVYPQAGHGFMNRVNAGPALTPLLRVAGMGHHHPSAEDAWHRIRVFFDRHLLGGGPAPG
jgi:carboxymethylenebutenolidase